MTSCIFRLSSRDNCVKHDPVKRLRCIAGKDRPVGDFHGASTATRTAKYPLTANPAASSGRPISSGWSKG